MKVMFSVAVMQIVHTDTPCTRFLRLRARARGCRQAGKSCRSSCITVKHVLQFDARLARMAPMHAPWPASSHLALVRCRSYESAAQWGMIRLGFMSAGSSARARSSSVQQRGRHPHPCSPGGAEHSAARLPALPAADGSPAGHAHRGRRLGSRSVRCDFGLAPMLI